ncbi:MAG TPA: hypothetical protein EYG16_05450 [Deltaproteobacteria bacterium]|nr:hypothetical protein [Candidatus Binatota bacterium]HIL13100.1 hypothetical protein [Deltaproteobacteria bacterium]
MTRKTFFRLVAVSVVLAVAFGVSSFREAMDEARGLRDLRIEDARQECKDRVRVARALLERGTAKATSGGDPCAAAEMLASAHQQAELATVICRPVTSGETMLTGPAARDNLARLQRDYSAACKAIGASSATAPGSLPTEK